MSRVGVPSVWLCWFTCLGSLAAYYWAADDRITAAVIGVVGISGLVGYWLGGAIVVAFLVAAGASTLLAGRIADIFGPAVAELLGTDGVLNRILAVCVGLTTIGFVAMLLVEIVWNRLLGRRTASNQPIGLSLGALQGGALSLLLLGAALVGEPYARRAMPTEIKSHHDFMRRCTADSVSRVGRASYASAVGPWLQTCNPFERVPPLRDVRANRPRPKTFGLPG